MILWLSGYLNSLILIPMCFSLSIESIDIYRALIRYTESKNTMPLAKLLNNTLLVIHEMQKQRGISAGYAGSKGQYYLSILPSQRLYPDRANADYRLVIASQNFYAQVSKQFSSFNNNLTQLSRIFAKIDGQFILVDQLLSSYTPNNHRLINLVSISANNIQERRSSQYFETLFSMASIKESSGIERVVLSTAFSRVSISQDFFVRFKTLVATLDAFPYSTTQMEKNFFLIDFLRRLKI